ncbi:MAG: hypothetical protein GXP63_05630 [DPANN group archaeon]|nr:hypothetical protein [DPANN group archaeon]
MRRRTLVLLMIAVFLLAVSATFLFYTEYVFQEKWEIPAQVTVDNRSGFQHDKAKMLFGNIEPGNFGKRFLNVSQNKEFPMDVKIGMRGDLSSWVQVSPEEFVLDPGQQVKVSFAITVPKDTPLGNYTGTANIVFLRTLG